MDFGKGYSIWSTQNCSDSIEHTKSSHVSNPYIYSELHSNSGTA